LTNFGACHLSLVHDSSYRGRTNPKKRIDNEVALIRERQNQPLDKGDWKLTRVMCLFHVVVLDIRDVPDVRRILATRVAGILSRLRSLKMLLAWVLLWDANIIEVEDVIIRLGEPEDNLVSPREPARTMKSMAKMPYDSIT